MLKESQTNQNALNVSSLQGRQTEEPHFAHASSSLTLSTAADASHYQKGTQAQSQYMLVLSSVKKDQRMRLTYERVTV